MDSNGYPEQDELDQITSWTGGLNELFGFLRERWHFANWGWREEENVVAMFGHPVTRYSISTGGWSGNESLIAAFERNNLAWHFTWVQSRVGGHYVFEVKREPN